MKIYQFIADSAGEALKQIRQQLGPQAVVLNVRQLPATGLSRLWARPRIEVLAGARQEEPSSVSLNVTDESPASPAHRVPEPAPSPVSPEAPEAAPAVSRFQSAPKPATTVLNAADLFEQQTGLNGEEPVRLGHTHGNGWKLESMLHSMGLAPVHADRVMDQLQGRRGATHPGSLREEISRACSVLAELWEEKPANATAHRLHVFVGPSGSGKTTALCKWLTQTTLLAGHSAHVWRLDGASANTAESLSVYGEILGVPVSRSPMFEEGAQADIGFIDLPGVDWKDPAALREMARQLTGLPPCQVHLVLNAAYETSILLAQAKAFIGLPVQDIVLTHLDEEPRWGKLWNLVLGTNYRVGWLSAGQNIPGTFAPASAGEILSRQFALK